MVVSLRFVIGIVSTALAVVACGGESAGPHGAAGSAGSGAASGSGGGAAMAGDSGKGGTSGSAGGAACDPPHFEDPGVGATLGPSVMQLGAENVTTALLTDVASLGGLECLTGLSTLRVTNGTLTNLAPLEGLASLRTVELAGVPVTDVSPLAGLVGLSSLALNGTTVVELRSLSGLVNLVSLSISSSKVADLDPLRGFTKLKILTATDSQITSLEPLADLGVLDQIDVSRTPLMSIVNLGPPMGTSSCPMLKALETSLDADTVNTTIPDLCALGWNIQWSEPGGDERTCGPGCVPRP